MTDLADLARRLEELERKQDKMRDALSKAESERELAESARDEYHQLYLQMMERCRKLERGLLGQKGEKLPSSEHQLSLGVLEMMLGEREKAQIEELTTQTVREHKRKKPTGRKPIPEHLPRVDIEIVPEEVQRQGLDAFKRIGEEVTEILERRPASLVVARIIKPKFIALNGTDDPTKVLVGSTPELPIERGLAGPGLLSDTVVRRWQDHQPTNRLEGIYRREGIDLARSTICGWHSQLTPLVEPLVCAMREDAFAQPFLCTDATGVLVQAKEKCRNGHFWVLVAPPKHVLFEYTPEHNSDAVDNILAGYEGYLVADAHVVYDHLYPSGDIIEVNCWAHCRRYYFKALQSDPERAKVALGLIGSLFKIERAIATAPKKKREKIRSKHSAPVVERFFSWCEEEWPKLLEDTPIYDGVRYARNQRKGLERFLSDGDLPLDNNISERELRRQAVGRKNWLFVGSDNGGRINALFTSLLASCRMNQIEPWAYLRDIFCLLPRWPVHRVLELAPAYWAETSATDEVQKRLEADPYRALTLLRE